MAFKINENELEKLANDINMVYMGRFYDDNKCHTYVKVICNKHNYKGIQILDVSRLYRWNQKGKCMCDLWNRDTEDLKRDPNLNNNIEIIGQYTKSNIKIECKCKKCNHIWFATPNKLQQGRGCPKCRDENIREINRKSDEQFKSELYKVQPDLEIVEDYNGAKTKIKYRCKKCGYEGESYPSNLLNLSASCRRCKSSIGERRISIWLQEHKINYKSEHTFPDCRSIEPLRFDFYLPDNNICIEFQGEQHYKPVCFRKDKAADIENNYIRQQQRDEIKRKYCKQNNILLIEIPYWEINNIESQLSKIIIYN